jgi:hypothetical protein
MLLNNIDICMKILVCKLAAREYREEAIIEELKHAAIISDARVSIIEDFARNEDSSTDSPLLSQSELPQVNKATAIKNVILLNMSGQLKELHIPDPYIVKEYLILRDFSVD